MKDEAAIRGSSRVRHSPVWHDCHLQDAPADRLYGTSHPGPSRRHECTARIPDRDWKGTTDALSLSLSLPHITPQYSLNSPLSILSFSPLTDPKPPPLPSFARSTR